MNTIRIYFLFRFFILILFGFFSICNPGNDSLAGQKVPMFDISSAKLLDDMEHETFFSTLASSLSNVKSFKTNFLQERHVSLFFDTLESEGVLAFAYPDKLRWEIRQPYSSILIYNQNIVAKYIMENEKLREVNPGAVDLLNTALGQIIAWMRGDFQESRELYQLKVYKGNEYLLRMSPFSEKMAEYLESIELVINPETYHISQVIINETGEDYIRLIFSNEEMNVRFDDNFFDVDNPSIAR